MVSGIATIEARRFQHGPVLRTLRILVRNARDVTDGIERARIAMLDMHPEYAADHYLFVAEWIGIRFDAIA